MTSDRGLLAARSAALSYDEVGATAGQLPVGYRQVRRTQDMGTGSGVFDTAVGRLMSWQMHRRAGLRVDTTTTDVRLGATVLLGLGVGPLRLHAPCRVVLIVDEPRRRGFAYGTLQGHPESGEELFEVDLEESDRVRFTITAFSRPATWLSRLGGPVSRRVQDVITDRYVVALAGPTTGERSAEGRPPSP